MVARGSGSGGAEPGGRGTGRGGRARRAWSPAPKRRAREPRELGEILPAVMRDLRPRNRGRLEEFRAAWEEILGRPAARRARVVSFSDGTLVVEVTSSAVKHHLSTFRADEILSELRRRVPGAHLRAIRYRVGS